MFSNQCTDYFKVSFNYVILFCFTCGEHDTNDTIHNVHVYKKKLNKNCITTQLKVRSHNVRFKSIFVVKKNR